MAVSKIWKVTVRLDQVIDYATNPEKTAAKEYSPEQYQALADVLQYAKDEEKTEREFYVGGINCNASTARDQFVTVKEQFDKCDGREPLPPKHKIACWDTPKPLYERTVPPYGKSKAPHYPALSGDIGRTAAD